MASRKVLLNDEEFKDINQVPYDEIKIYDKPTIAWNLKAKSKRLTL